jgi:hypothetical protein
LPLLCLALALPGCIFAEPPERDPRQTPVFFDLGEANPSTTQLQHFSIQDPQRDFTVPFRSEDAGDVIRWAVHINYAVGGGSDSVARDEVEASTLADTSRKITFKHRPANITTDRCQQLTLMACHEDSFVFSQQACVDNEDTAYATWWVTLSDGPDLPSFDECPQPAQTP